MSRSVNKVLLLGNVGQDPEVRTTASGTKVARISLATNRVFNDRSGQRQEKTDWHRVVCWDKTAEIVEKYVRKGDRLYVDGRIEYSQSDDGQGGTRYWTDIVAREIVLLGSAGAGAEGGQPRQARQPASAATPANPSSPFDDEVDDLPF